jgi:hypothetical protein
VKLPEIVPASPVQSAAGQIERAGAAAGEAGRTWGQYFLEDRKAELEDQSKTAAVDVAAAIHNVKQFIESQPYLKVADAETLFGGALPPGVKAEREILLNGKVVTVKEPVVPMHKLVKPLYAQRMAEAVQNAAGRIDSETFRKRFVAAAEAKVESARGEILDWQRAQFLADQELRAVSEFNRAVNVEAWGEAAQIANLMPTVKLREEALRELPRIEAKTKLIQKLGSSNPKIIREGQQEARTGYAGVFSEEERQHFVDIGDRELARIDAAARQALKDAQDRAEATAYGVYAQARAASLQPGGRPPRETLKATDIFRIPNLRPEAATKLLDLIATGGDPIDDPTTKINFFTALANERNGFPGPKLSDISPEEMSAARLYLSPSTHDYFLKEWSAVREGGAAKLALGEHDVALIQNRLEKVFGWDKDSPDFVTMTREAMIQLSPVARARKKEGIPLSAADVDLVLSQVAPIGSREVFVPWWKTNVPEVAKSLFGQSIRLEGQDVPAPEQIERAWRSAEAAKDTVGQVWKMVRAGTPFRTEDLARVWAQEINTPRRQQADEIVALREAAAPPDRPAFPSSWTPEMKRYAVYMERGITATDRTRKAEMDAAERQRVQSEQIRAEAAAAEAAAEEKAAREKAVRREIIATDEAAAEKQAEAAAAAALEAARKEIEARKKQDMDDWRRRTREAQERAKGMR